MNKIEYKDRKSTFPNRRKIKILNQNAEEIIADIEMLDEPTEKGTSINAEQLNYWQDLIEQNEKDSSEAKSKSVTAENNSINAKTNALDALDKSSYAEICANESKEKSLEALDIANRALEQVVTKQGTKVNVNGEYLQTFNADIKADVSYVDSIKSELQTRLDNQGFGLIAKADLNNLSQTIKAKEVRATTGDFDNITDNINNINNSLINRNIKHFTKQTTSYSESNITKFTATWQIVEIPIQSTTEGSSNQYSLYIMWYSRTLDANGHKEYKINTPITFSSLTFMSPSVSVESKGNWERRGNATIDMESVGELIVKMADDTGGEFTHFVKVMGIAISGQ